MLSPFAGDAGESAATFTGGIALDTTLPTQNGKAVVSAATPIAAIQAALVNTITATVGTTSASYSPDPDTIGTTTAAHLPFVITTTATAGQFVLHLEDLALMPGMPPDWDYNDRTWTVVVTPVVDPPVVAPSLPPSSGSSPVAPGPVVVTPDPIAPPVPTAPATPSQPGPYPIPPTSPPPPTGTIHGWAWNDGPTGDGIQQTTEDKLNGVGVWLYSVSSGSCVAQTWTNDVGEYQFTGLSLGQYKVSFRPPVEAAYTLYHQGTDPQVDSDVATATTSGYGWTEALSLTASDPIQWYISAGMQVYTQVAGRMWTDLNGDGIQDTGEPGEWGRTVQLLKNGAVAATASTDEDGRFSFQVIRDPAAQYTVKFVKPDGYTFSPDFAGDDRTIDSDTDAEGLTPEVFTTSSPQGALGGGAVLPANSSQWSIPNKETAEGNGTSHQITFTVKRRGPLGQATSVGYKTVDGTAVAGQDYDLAVGTLDFAVDQATAMVTETIKEDTVKENDEEFFLVLKSPNFTVTPDGSTSDGRVTPFGRGIIRNDDFPNTYVDGWAEWVVDPRASQDADTNYKNGTWMLGWDGDTPTYLTPTGTPWVHSMIDEGHYLKHSSAQPYGAFEFIVDWRVADAGQAATPMRPTGVWAQPQNAEHFGNSGVYIYNMYEVQINSTNVPFGQAVPDPPPPPGQTPTLKTQVTPGWPYKVPVPAGQGIYNHSVTPGQWNRMRIKFTPPTIVNGAITVAAKLKVSFEFNGGTLGYVTFGGFNGWELLGADGTKLKGTGSRQTDTKLGPADVGRIFLQSHWGSLVEFKNPSFV